MVELEGEAIGELSTLIAKAFDRAELKFLLKVRLDFDLERELNTAAGDDQLAFELILALERRRHRRRLPSPRYRGAAKA
jgi:hypothetical protein